MSTEIDTWLSAAIRTQIEAQYYAQINRQAAFERLRLDPSFMADLHTHVGLFSDHGVVHVRDVARQVLAVLHACHGVLIPRRPAARFARLCGYGVLLAYFHDIGMVDFSTAGRHMHPEFAAQAVFDPALDPLIAQIWRENSGGLAEYAAALAAAGAPTADPQRLLRELLALSMAHSKRKVPIAVLNDPPRLRRTLQQAIRTNLHLLDLQQRLAAAPRQPRQPDTSHEADAAETALAAYAGPAVNPHVGRFYADVAQEAFAWLVATAPPLPELRQDVTDTVRALRAADALRQRGTYLKTSGNYEVFADSRTGNAVYALRHGDDRLFLLETTDQISAGEANIAGSELDTDGNLRITFHRGAFTAPGSVSHAAESAARVVRDIQDDVLESFVRPPGDAERQGLKTAVSAHILLEETADNPEFVRLVAQHLGRLAPALAGRIGITPSLQHSTDAERTRYLAGQPVNWPMPQRHDLLQRLQASGHRSAQIDAQQAFDHVRLVALAAGEILITAGTPAVFVYIPLGSGLKVEPLGGYQAFAVQPWMPLGVTGVIRGAVRNATVTAEAPLQLLMLPKSVYLQHWHHTHTPDSFRQMVADLPPAADG